MSEEESLACERCLLRIQQLEEALEQIEFRSWSNIRDVQGLRRQLKDINNIAVAALSSEAATSEAPEKEEE